MVAFARHARLPLTEVLQWHPRDIETWMALDEVEAQEQRFAAMRQGG